MVHSAFGCAMCAPKFKTNDVFLSCGFDDANTTSTDKGWFRWVTQIEINGLFGLHWEQERVKKKKSLRKFAVSVSCTHHAHKCRRCTNWIKKNLTEPDKTMRLEWIEFSCIRYVYKLILHSILGWKFMQIFFHRSRRIPWILIATIQ